LRKRAQKGSPDMRFPNNTRMVYDHPAFFRSNDSGLNAFFPTLVFCLDDLCYS
jgi:hypothetical protein